MESDYRDSFAQVSQLLYRAGALYSCSPVYYRVNPKSEVQSTVIQKWMRSIDATENDFKLMLNCFEVSHQVG